LNLFLKDDSLHTALGGSNRRRQPTATTTDDGYVSFEGPIANISIDGHSFLGKT
jgi:hypothetical protein